MEKTGRVRVILDGKPPLPWSDRGGVVGEERRMRKTKQEVGEKEKAGELDVPPAYVT